MAGPCSGCLACETGTEIRTVDILVTVFALVGGWAFWLGAVGGRDGAAGDGVMGSDGKDSSLDEFVESVVFIGLGMGLGVGCFPVFRDVMGKGPL